MMRLFQSSGVLAASALLIAAPALSQRAEAPFIIGESGQGFATLQEAVDAIGEGSGTIRIAPGRYRDCAVQTAGSVAYVAQVPGRAILEGVCEDKAALVLRGRESRVEGIVFRYITVPDGNGAGIRMEQGDLFVSQAMFLDCQSGILAANDMRGAIRVDHSTFAGLGKDPTGNGAHAMYINGHGTLSVTRSRFERGTGGHYLKSRVPTVEVLDNSFDDSAGQDTNYMIDLSWGATGRIAGNSFVQGPNKENYGTLIAVAPEGAENPSAGLVIEDNRVWLAAGFRHRTTFVGNWSGDALVVRNNVLADRVTEVERR